MAAYELETDDGDTLEIDFNSKEVKGYTSKKNLKKQMEVLKEIVQ